MNFPNESKAYRAARNKLLGAEKVLRKKVDALEGNARHITQRTNLVVVAKSPIERILEFTRARGWRNLRLLSSAANDYNRDYHGEAPDGSQWPLWNALDLTPEGRGEDWFPRLDYRG